MAKAAVAVDPRYPVGKFDFAGPYSEAQRKKFIEAIAQTPAKMRAAVKGLKPKQLDTPYREGGWTVRQVVHHVPDSHLNAYTRLKLALTETEPTIRPYDQEAWARLADTRQTPIETSLELLASLHERWVNIWRSLKPEDFARTLRHPESGLKTVDWLLGLYAWHGAHHVAHITELRKRMGW